MPHTIFLKVVYAQVKYTNLENITQNIDPTMSSKMDSSMGMPSAPRETFGNDSTE